MADVAFNVFGFRQANAGLTAVLWDPATNTQVASVKPLADGTGSFRNVPPGNYLIRFPHDHLAFDVAAQPVSVLPTGATVSILIDPSKFRNTPIADVVNANLTPITQSAESIERAVGQLANAKGGEVIFASHFNQLATSIRDLAHSVGALSRGVAPQGHNHPEYEAKLTEMSANFENLLNMLTISMVELQRRSDIQRLRDRVQDLLDVPGVTVVAATRKKVFDLLTELEARTTETPAVFSALLRSAATQIDTLLTPAKNSVPASDLNVVSAFNDRFISASNQFVTGYNVEFGQRFRDRFTDVSQSIDSKVGLDTGGIQA
jgi:hypothetical protein